MEEMSVELWSGLPTEIMERTLPFLSVPVLCRFRTVCKRWNSLICNPEFGALCIQRARQDALFLVARYTIRGKKGHNVGGDVGSFDDNHGWSFLDLNTRRWYTIKKDEREVFDCFARQGNMAMDKGLVCQLLEDVVHEEVSILFSNPIAKTFKRLPTSSCINRYVDIAVTDMVVDSVARNYKLFVMPNASMNLSNALMIIYDSTTNQWRSVHSPMMNIIGFNYIADVKSSVWFNGLLYLLMAMGEDGTTKQHRLWSYNHAEDSWNDTDVTVDHLELGSPQLIVSDNRLFLGSWFRQDRQSVLLDPHNAHCRRWSYEISEINLEARSRTQVFQSSGDRLKQWAQDFSTSNSFDGKRGHLHIKAFGFCKSIMLLSDLTGVSKVYDLSTRSWDLLPRNPLMNNFPGAVMQGRGRCLNFGKPMNLILPASTMWEQESEAGF